MEIRHTCAITGAHTLTNKSILYTLAGEGKAALLLRFSSIDQIFMLQLQEMVWEEVKNTITSYPHLFSV